MLGSKTPSGVIQLKGPDQIPLGEAAFNCVGSSLMQKVPILEIVLSMVGCTVIVVLAGMLHPTAPLVGV